MVCFSVVGLYCIQLSLWWVRWGYSLLVDLKGRRKEDLEVLCGSFVGFYVYREVSRNNIGKCIGLFY